MDPVSAAILIGTGIQAVGSVKAGKAQKAQAEQEAKQLERERALTRIQATQSMTAMAQDYAMATSANDAFFAGVLGRDVSDRSLRAFKQRQEEIYSTDVKRLASDTNMRAKILTLSAAATRQSGRNALSASYFNAMGQVAGGIYQYGQVGGDVPQDSQNRKLSLSFTAGGGDTAPLNSDTRTSSGYRRYLVRSS